MTSTLLALVVALGMWTGLARAVVGAPVYAFVLDAATIAFLLGACVVAWPRRRDLHAHPVDLLAATFVAFAVVEIFNPNVPSVLVGVEGFRKTAFTVAGYAIVRLTPGFDGERFVRLVALGAIPALVWSIRQWLAPFGVEQLIIDSSGVSSTSFHSGTVLRAFAPTASPFHLGILAGAVAIIAAVFRTPIRVWGTVALIAAFALGLSLTRANIIATIVALAVVATVQVIRQRRPWLVGAGVLIGALTVVVALGAASSRPPYRVDPPPTAGATQTPAAGATNGAGGDGGIALPDPTKDKSLRFRFQFWEAQLNAFVDQPLIGYGTSAAADGFGRLYAGRDSVRFEPHSIYLKILLEQGVIGAIVFGLLLLALGFLAVRGQIRGTPFDLIALGVIVLLLVSGLTGPMLDAYPFNLFFWIIVGGVVSGAATGYAARPSVPMAMPAR